MLKNTCKLNKNSYMYITFNYRLWWWNYALFWLYYFLLLIEIQVKINYYCFSLVFKFSVSFNSKQKQRTKILRKLRIKHRLKPWFSFWGTTFTWPLFLDLKIYFMTIDIMGKVWSQESFKSRLSLIVLVNIVLNRTVVVDSDRRYWLRVFIANNITA